MVIYENESKERSEKGQGGGGVETLDSYNKIRETKSGEQMEVYINENKEESEKGQGGGGVGGTLDIYNIIGGNHTNIENEIINKSLGMEKRYRENGKRTQKIQQKSNSGNNILKFGFININGVKTNTWGDIEEEFKEEELEVVCIVETHMRNRSSWEGKYYRMEAKGRDKAKKRGGGIAIMIGKNKGWVFEEFTLQESAIQEDMLIGCLQNKDKKIKPIIIVSVYMTTGESNMVIEENRKKYSEIKKIISQYREKDLVIIIS